MIRKPIGISAERYLAGAVFVSVALAAIAAQFQATSFGRFKTMAITLVSADFVVYAVMRLRRKGNS